jgi:DNA-binding transcriptional ArsR family regulator/anti-anti-sigma regulatory factor
VKTSDIIIDYLGTHSQVNTPELVEYLGITDRAVRKQLKSLLEKGVITKLGKAPRAYYSITILGIDVEDYTKIKDLIRNIEISNQKEGLIEREFYYISPRGEVHQGLEGFMYWCQERKLDYSKTAQRYIDTYLKYHSFEKGGLINGLSKLKSSFDEVALDELFYIDFYSVEIFGKTKLGQMLLFAKQSQNRALINGITVQIKPVITKLIKDYKIDGVGFIPPTVKRELQLMKQLEKQLNLNSRIVSIRKIKTPIAVPQKTLNKIEDRIINARETLKVDDTGKYGNILLIDDAVGSGSTLNETAKKIKQRGICEGKLIGLAITGSFKGFDVISEV